MVITETEIPGQYLFRAPDTSSWPTGCYLYMDIQYESDGVKSSSEIIRMVVERDAKYTIWR
jgi:hypothetical protein